MSSDSVFLAIANPVRRRLLELLAEGPANAGELARAFDLSRPAVAEHLQVLGKAGLVSNVPAGRHRTYSLVAAPLAEVDDWLHPFERFWRDRLGVLARIAEEGE